MNKIRMTFIIGLFLLATLLFAVSVNAVCLVDTCLSINELREKDILKEVSYGYGYTDGYNDQMRAKPSNPSAIFSKFRRVSTEDPAYYEAEIAYIESGKYRSGYSAGYTDAKNSKERAVPSDFLKQYGVEEEATVEVTSTNTVYGKYNIPDVSEIDTLGEIENFAYDLGYDDALNGYSKAPLKIMYDLSKDETPDVRAVYETIRDNRGAFSKKYKEGYDAGLAAKATVTDSTGTKTTQLQTTTRASQLSGEEQAENAYAVGYRIGMMHAQDGAASNPQLVLNYDWILNARYTSDAEQISENWYTLPEGISQSDVEQAMADETSYMEGYREGYNLGLNSGFDEEMSDDEIVYQIGCEVGTADGEAGIASNPYTYTWKTHRYVTKTEEIEYSKMIRYNRADYITGYRECYAAASG